MLTQISKTSIIQSNIYFYFEANSRIIYFSSSQLI